MLYDKSDFFRYDFYVAHRLVIFKAPPLTVRSKLQDKCKFHPSKYNIASYMSFIGLRNTGHCVGLCNTRKMFVCNVYTTTVELIVHT